jgi:hypothetical protein
MQPSHPGSASVTSRRAAYRRRLHRGALCISTLLRVSVAGLLIGIVASVIVWGLSETAPSAQSAEPEQYIVVTVQFARLRDVATGAEPYCADWPVTHRLTGARRG